VIEFKDHAAQVEWLSWSRDGRTQARKEVAVRVLAASMLIGSLVLIGAPAKAAGWSMSSDTYLHLVDAGNLTGERDAYIQKARNEMQDWQQKLHNFGEKAKQKGQKEGSAGRRELNSAWTKTKTEAHRLETAGAGGWEKAKTSYENASHALADAWGRIRPEDK
jgi:hypothetical protein